MLMIPRTGLREPSRDSSPTKAQPSISFCWSSPARMRTLIAIGRSKREPSFSRSAGARLITSFWLGKEKPELLMADLTRSRASEMVLEPMPTMLKLGRPLFLAPSTLISAALNPSGIIEVVFAIITSR